MNVRKLHLIIVAQLINFGLLLKLDELKYYKPSGEKSRKEFSRNFLRAHRQITSIQQKYDHSPADMRHLF